MHVKACLLAILIDWISYTCAQEYTHLPSLVKCLDHRDVSACKCNPYKPSSQILNEVGAGEVNPIGDRLIVNQLLVGKLSHKSVLGVLISCQMYTATGLPVSLSCNGSTVLCSGETEQHQEAGQEGGEAFQEGSAALEKRSKAFQRGNAAPQEHSTAAFQENGKATQESGRRRQVVINECVVRLLDRWALPGPEGLLLC